MCADYRVLPYSLREALSSKRNTEKIQAPRFSTLPPAASARYNSLMADTIRIEKAQRIRDVIRYVDRFKNAVVVIYLDDIDSPLFTPAGVCARYHRVFRPGVSAFYHAPPA